jgi:mannose-1-phosphate guanylyltransferase/mannose-6-phosphate isomerase
MRQVVPVILAGGIGERFWPLSRSTHPKQLMRLASRRTMIEETFSRARLIQARRARPLVITGGGIASRMKALLSKRWRYDLIVEPVGKNTAPAVALAAAWIRARYGESLMAVLPADHSIWPADAWVRAVKHACAVADARDRLVVFGVKPTRPDTGYGYILLGKQTGSAGGVKSYDVARFIEKPGAASARRYCASGRFRWNSGMFVWKAGVLLGEVRTHMPALYSLVMEAEAARFSRRAIDRFYRKVEKESVDYGIMERSDRVSAVAGDFRWDDIGSWEAVARLHAPKASGTTAIGSPLYESDCRNSILFNASRRAVAAIGCEEIAVIATDDAVLVIDRSKLPEIKKHLMQMKQSPGFSPELF